MILANTKQIRNLMRYAMMDVDANPHKHSYTEKTQGNRSARRSVVFIVNRNAPAALIKLNALLKIHGFSNKATITSDSGTFAYLRCIANLA